MHWNHAGRQEPAFPAWAGPAERLRHLLRYAVRAPSRHNAQPWLFDIEGPELRVRVDPRRGLKVVDPHGREAAIACGAAAENVRIAAAHFGHDAEVETGAPGRDGPLAVIRLAGRRRSTLAEEELFEAIPLRRTALTLDSRSVAPEEMARLAAEVAGDGMVRRVPRWLARPVAELVAEADALQWSSARFRAELALWTRRTRRIPLDGLAPDRVRTSPGGLLRRLLRRSGLARAAETDRRFDERTRSLLVLSTRGDDPPDWVAAGRAMQRLLLRATASGLSVAFMSQPIELPDVRRRLRRELGDPGMPQLLLRVGHAPPPRSTRRRPVDLVLRSFATDLAVEVGIEVEPVPAARRA